MLLLGEPEPLGIARLMKTYNFVATILLLCDVLPHVLRLSKLLQSKLMDITFLQAELKMCLDSIQSVRDDVTQGCHFSRAAAECEDVGIQLTATDEENYLHKTGYRHTEILLFHNFKMNTGNLSYIHIEFVITIVLLKQQNSQ